MHHLKPSCVSSLFKQGVRLQRIASRNFSTTTPIIPPSVIHPKKPPLASPFSSLREPYPDIPPPEILPPGSTDVHITKLHNGIIVASLDFDGPITNVAAIIRTGSKFENAINYGVNAVIDRMFWKGSQRYSYNQINDIVDSSGALIGTQVGREIETLSADVLTTKLPDLMQLLGDTVCSPAFSEELLQVGKESVPATYNSLISEPIHLIPDLLHKAAWGDQGYGNPIYPPDADHITLEIVENYYRDFFVGERMALIATGVKHDTFVKLCQKHFGSIHPSPRNPIVAPQTDFVGGELMITKEKNHPESPFYIPNNAKEIIHMAFGVKTVGYKDPDYVITCLLDTILGGGYSFSAGGPGKGMLSLLYQDILMKSDYVDSINSAYYPYEDQGIFGLTASSYADKGPELTSSMLHILRELDTKITPEFFNRGVNQLKSAILMKLENRYLRTTDIGTQVVFWGKYRTAQDFCREIDSITLKDLKKFINRRFRDYSNSAFIAFGYEDDMSTLPLFNDMKNYLHYTI